MATVKFISVLLKQNSSPKALNSYSTLQDKWSSNQNEIQYNCNYVTCYVKEKLLSCILVMCFVKENYNDSRYSLDQVLIGSQEHNTWCPRQDLNLRSSNNLLKTYDHQSRCFTLFIRDHILPPFIGLCQSLCWLV